MRVIVAFILAAFSSMTPVTLAGDVAPSQPPNDPVAESILQKARQAVVAAPRLKIECDWSDVEHLLETETLSRHALYVEKSIGYLSESWFVPLAGQSSRARTRLGRPYPLRSQALPNTRQLYRDRSVTFFDKLDRKKYVVESDPDYVKRCEPAVVIGALVPPGLSDATGWEEVRSHYRIEKGASTPSTIAIVLTPRNAKSPPTAGKRESDPNRQAIANFIRDQLSEDRVAIPGFNGAEWDRHEIVLDSRSLRPVSWRRVCDYSDWLETYTRFDLNPPAEDLTPPPPNPHESLAVILETRSDGQPDPSDLDDSLTAIRSAFCLLRLFDLL
ncbi:MAG TPA: hypothetical protein VEI07_16555 [Planctomycetaceae bacterium]|nr:hypothetical protein [Planctomycetaceae bacterium]